MSTSPGPPDHGANVGSGASTSTSSGTAHWDGAYAQGATTRSWHQHEATESLDLLDRVGVPASASVADVGGGASTLVDGLLDRGHEDVTVVDLSPVAIAAARERLGDRSDDVAWVVSDLLAWEPGRTFGVWHDRAVLHFLVDDATRTRYAELAIAAVAPGGWMVIGGFAPDGPNRCSGLPVRGANAEDLVALVGPSFAPVLTSRTTHTTPSGTEQSFAWLAAQRRSA